MLACLFFSALLKAPWGPESRFNIFVSPEPKVVCEKQSMFVTWMNKWTSAMSQRPRIKYLTFSNPEVICGLLGSQNIATIGLPSPIFPTPNSTGWGRPKLSLECLEMPRFRDSLLLPSSLSASGCLCPPSDSHYVPWIRSILTIFNFLSVIPVSLGQTVYKPSSLISYTTNTVPGRVSWDLDSYSQITHLLTCGTLGNYQNVSKT